MCLEKTMQEFFRFFLSRHFDGLNDLGFCRSLSLSKGRHYYWNKSFTSGAFCAASDASK
jgi:hypothetical protein